MSIRYLCIGIYKFVDENKHLYIAEYMFAIVNILWDITVITIGKHVHANILMCIGVYRFLDVNNCNKIIVVDKFVLPMRIRLLAYTNDSTGIYVHMYCR